MFDLRGFFGKNFFGADYFPNITAQKMKFSIKDFFW